MRIQSSVACVSAAAICLLAGAAAAPSAAAANDLDVAHYDVRVSVHDQHLVETVTVRLAPGAAPSTAEFEVATALKIDSVRSGGAELPFIREGWALRVDLSGCQSTDGAPTFEVRCSGRPYNKQPNGLVRTTVATEIAYIRGQYPWYPRAPNDPATYRIAIDARADWHVHTVGVPSGAVVSEGRRTTTFEQARPIREAGLIAGAYTRVEQDGAAALVLDGHERGARHLLAVAGSALAHYTERWGSRGDDALTIVEMPSAFGAGSGYGESGYVLIGSGAFVQAGDAPWADELVAHEVAHLWWGQAVAFANFAHESLATWAAHGFTEETIGPAVARQQRARAVESVAKSEALGQGLALADIRDYGAGLPGMSYRAHAYDKGLMLLVMLEDVVGRHAVDKALRKLREKHTGARIDYATLRSALTKTGRGAASLLKQWERPGLPELRVVDTKVEVGEFRGAVRQSGTKPKYAFDVDVLVLAGGKEATETVSVKKASVGFSVSLPLPRMPIESFPSVDAVVIDPEYRLLAVRRAITTIDAQAEISAAFDVVNSPSERDDERLRGAVARLRTALRAGAGKQEGRCHTGIGRCLFRLGAHADAAIELRTALALGPGGPFHARWIRLRLGNLADLDGRRDDAKAHYERVIGHGKDDAQTHRARTGLERPYRGLDQGG